MIASTTLRRFARNAHACLFLTAGLFAPSAVLGEDTDSQPSIEPFLAGEQVLSAERAPVQSIFPGSLATFLQAETEPEAPSLDEGSLSVEDDNDDTLAEALKMLSESEAKATQEEMERSDDVAEEFESEDSDSTSSIFEGREPSIESGKFKLPPLQAATTATDQIGNGEIPEDYRSVVSTPVEPLYESGVDRGYPWQWTTRYWAAANTFSHPLYFEDRMLERHGHQRFPHLQPMISGGRFVTGAFMLPYLTALSHPSDCEYSLGYYRAGSCAPTLKQRPPWKRKAVLSQAAWTGAGIWVLP